VSDEMQKRAITLLAAGISYGISHYLTERFIDIPERRGISDDVLEAALKGGTRFAATVIASVVIRRAFTR
jgi:hypothetical protein